MKQLHIPELAVNCKDEICWKCQACSSNKTGISATCLIFDEPLKSQGENSF